MIKCNVLQLKIAGICKKLNCPIENDDSDSKSILQTYMPRNRVFYIRTNDNHLSSSNPYENFHHILYTCHFNLPSNLLSNFTFSYPNTHLEIPYITFLPSFVLLSNFCVMKIFDLVFLFDQTKWLIFTCAIGLLFLCK